ncbi:MAG: glutamine-hydrolyzing GMP synthase [Candidatus Omnitrophica bacterium]|nr:glutamine-hydrolyzing GMP synthase [Candidatus Omnitrophota bacterium]
MRRKNFILILDFGSQYTQLIARRVREMKVFSQIVPHNIPATEIDKLAPKGLILSGGPASVYDKSSPDLAKNIFKLGIPILGICYGMQIIAESLGGKVKFATEREFGSTELFIDSHKDLFDSLPSNLTCWMSHGDQIKKLPQGFVTIAHTLNTPIAAIGNRHKKIFGVQFHPEVEHTQRGNQILNNFIFKICGCFPRWTMDSFIDESINKIKETVGNKNVICGLSGGVDSSVTAVLIHKAIKNQLKCIFIDNGLLRKDEPEQVKRTFRSQFHISLKYVNATKRFLEKLKGVLDPEQKRKIIGHEFIRVFEKEALGIKKVKFFAQGTLYPDVIESVSATGAPSARIKTHHNVGGLPKDLKFQLIEPLRDLFKDEVRAIGKQLGMPDHILYRQPFPGPGLAIRIIGEATKERLEVLRNADEIVMDEIKKVNLYHSVWQSFAILLPIKTVGVMGDKRSYENVIAFRCVTSKDGMTADWVKLPPELLEKISNRIINEVKGINRVVYDISSKPPATIEWE